jgi:hypothetical protein
VVAFSNGTASLSWAASREKDVVGYVVACGPVNGADSPRIRVNGPAVTLPGTRPGTLVSVKAVNEKGMEGWDWTSVVVR